MRSVAGNPSSGASKGGFTLLEVIVALSLLSVVLFTVSQTMVLVFLRSLQAMELALAEDQGARFVSSITLATKTATAWGIYSDLDAYSTGPESNLAPQGNVMVCDSATQTGAPILYVFVYNPISRTLKRFENEVNTARMTLHDVLPTSGSLFDQDLGLVQGHWQMLVRNQLLTFSAYGTPPRMR
jgi:prepilin-type N-terminal cleavage/methylation domain-containing protein